MIWAAAWLVAMFYLVRLLYLARRADDVAALARHAAQALGEPAAGDVAELLLPWPGVQNLADVRREFPNLSDELVYSVAQARARLRRRAPGPLG